MWDMLKTIWRAFDAPLPSFSIPTRVAFFLSLLFVFIAKIISPIVTWTPTLTPLRVANATTTKTYNITKAKTVLGYRPIVPMKDGINTTLAWFKKLDEESAKAGKAK
jgi:sterol-4alpha-carboxylate 3-dehydrogenase (decarboxylating)